jgi:hypothetical protein
MWPRHFIGAVPFSASWASGRGTPPLPMPGERFELTQVAPPLPRTLEALLRVRPHLLASGFYFPPPSSLSPSWSPSPTIPCRLCRRSLSSFTWSVVSPADAACLLSAAQSFSAMSLDGVSLLLILSFFLAWLFFQFYIFSFLRLRFASLRI